MSIESSSRIRAMSNAVSVLKFAEIRAEDLPQVGGKGANLGEMTAAGLPIPDGFCITTAAYARFIAQLPEFDRMLDALDGSTSPARGSRQRWCRTGRRSAA